MLALFVVLFHIVWLLYRSTRDWKDDEVETLIQEVSHYPCLFEPSHPDFIDSELRATTRRKIASVIDNDDCSK